MTILDWEKTVKYFVLFREMLRSDILRHEGKQIDRIFVDLKYGILISYKDLPQYIETFFSEDSQVTEIAEYVSHLKRFKETELEFPLLSEIE